MERHEATGPSRPTGTSGSWVASAAATGPLDLLLDEAPVAVCLREVRGEDLLHVVDSAFAAALLGRTRAEVEGRTDLELGVPVQMVERSLVRARRVMDRGEPEEFEADMQLPGRTVRLAGRLFPVPATCGAPPRFLLIGQEVGTLRALERSILDADRMVGLGTLAAAAAHEIAGPAGAALATVQALLADLPPSGRAGDRRIREDLGDIACALERVCELTRDLRSVARPGRDHDCTDLPAVIRSTLGLAGRAARTRVTTVLRAVPGVRGNPVRLGQVVLNLLSNALKATEANGGEVVLETWSAGAKVGLAVRDRGAGIAPEVAALLFQPFATSRAGQGGTGLGLFVVQRILRELGGTIRLLPREAGGVEALVELPAWRRAREPGEPPRGSDPG
jgi:C4-dicarboxylate-specific signal transduction histidine kinase